MPEFSLYGPQHYVREGGDSEVLAGLVAPALGRKIEMRNQNTVIASDSDRRPRRIWDVCANRVVPTTWFPSELTEWGLVALSHAWVAVEEREYIYTSVNCHTWPVPIPRDVTIDDIRLELLSRNVRFAWLDILCLRQDMKPLAAQNREVLIEINKKLPGDLKLAYSVVQERLLLQSVEWKSDVPLIGDIYQRPNVSVLVYLNGVGRPCTTGHWHSKYHWVRRAWTMQEIVALKYMMFAGLGKQAQSDLLACKVSRLEKLM